MMKRQKRPLSAQATIAIIAAMTLVMVEIGILISTVSLTQYRNQTSAVKATQALLLADSGLEEALYRLHLDATYSGGNLTLTNGGVQIEVTSTGARTRSVVATSTGTTILREISAEINVAKPVNPLEDLAVFAGDDVKLVKSNAALFGNLWTNDNIDLDDSTRVYGNVYSAGQGNASKSQIRNSARVSDNPNTAEVEGNVFAVDKIEIINSGIVDGNATSSQDVRVSSGGILGGSALVDPTLGIETIVIPTFNFDDYEQQAQAQGTYYTSPAQFLAYLVLNNYTIDSGIHFIDSTSTLTIPSGTTVNFTGSLVSRGDIVIQSTSYTHTFEDNLPAIASQGSISFTDQLPCNCTADITGVVFSEQQVTSKHDQYTGGQTYAVNFTGTVWGADQVTLEDRSRLTFDADIVKAVIGFNFSTTNGVEDPSTNNTVDITEWDIN